MRMKTTRTGRPETGASARPLSDRLARRSARRSIGRHLSKAARFHGALGLALLISAAPASAEPKAYPDGHGGEVMFPEGDISFADGVVHYDTGDKEPKAAARDPKAALGIPGHRGETGETYTSLGCGGTLDLEFTDNFLIDVPGPDLYVFEVGPDVEPTALAISQDGDSWTRIGGIEGGKAEIDIAPYVGGDEEFGYVRLVDLRSGCGSSTPGADIDAVGAIGSATRIALDSSVLFDTGEYRLEPAASDVIAKAMADVDPQNLQSIEVAGHTDAVGSAESNQELSQNRADAVLDYLTEEAGFASDLVTAKAWGETRPIASNDTAEGRTQNRRVELTVRRTRSEEAAQTAPIEILGLWDTSADFTVELRHEDGENLGTYTSDNGRIRGEFTSETVFEGYWIEDDSKKRCDVEKAGSNHWGRLRLEFDGPDRDLFEGKWRYCGEGDWRGKWASGERII